jgi:hypothetical protein
MLGSTPTGAGSIPTAGDIGGLGGVGGFGSDTLVKLPNSAATPVTALELVTTLPTNTAGAENSQWDVKLLSAGAQITAFSFTPGQVLAPPQLATTAPSYSFLGAGRQNSGWSVTGTGATQVLQAVVNGTPLLQIDWNNAALWTNSVYSFAFGTDFGRGTKGKGTGQGDNVCLFSTNGNMQIGDDGALATNATIGFLDWPSCAGAPTGAPSKTRTGKTSAVFDTTNSKIWFRVGATWKGVVVA